MSNTEKIQEVLNQIQNKSKRYRFNMYDEKTLQDQLHDKVMKDLGFIKEYRLDGKHTNIIDFYHPKLKFGVEVKVKGQIAAIYRQLKRYAQTSDIEELALLTNLAYNIPTEIEGKPSHFIRIGSNWL